MRKRRSQGKTVFGKRSRRIIRWILLSAAIIFAFILISFLINLISRALLAQILLPTSEEPGFFRYSESICALIAAFLVVEQLRKETESEHQETLVQQSTFIKEYNQSFIENNMMVGIEMELEEFYVSAAKAYKDCMANGKNGDAFSQRMKELKENFKYNLGNPGSPKRQAYIDYLVYLEGLATVIQNGAMEIKNIDSLFGYRFFIAVNNPVVQELELEKYAIHYRGIFWLYEQWVSDRKAQVEHLLEEYLSGVSGADKRVRRMIRQAKVKESSAAWKNSSADIGLEKRDDSLGKTINRHKELLESLTAHCSQTRAKRTDNSKHKRLTKALFWIPDRMQDRLVNDLEELLVRAQHLEQLMSRDSIGRYGIPLHTDTCALSRLENYEATIDRKSSLRADAKAERDKQTAGMGG